MGRGQGLKRLTSIFRRESEQQRHERLKEEYPFNGPCPVRERTADGVAVGRCNFPLRGPYCPRHGNLQEHLVVDESDTSALHRGRDWRMIDENDIPTRAEGRDFGPEGLFKDF